LTKKNLEKSVHGLRRPPKLNNKQQISTEKNLEKSVHGLMRPPIQ
jgi:hypothetical protein